MKSITSKLPSFPKLIPPSINNLRPISSIPTSSTSFPISIPPCHLIIKSSSPNPQNLPPLKTLQPFPILKTTFIAALATTVLFLSRFDSVAIAVIPPTQTGETEEEDTDSVEEKKERKIEEHLNSNPNDIDALKTSVGIQIKNGKIDEGMSIVDKLIGLEPNEVEWKLLKGRLYIYKGDKESAKIMFNEIIPKHPLRLEGVVDKLIALDPNEVEWKLLKARLYIYKGDKETAEMKFNEIIKKDPLFIEAYRGLVNAASHYESVRELKVVEERIEEGMRLAKKEDKKGDLREFRLLIAQVWVFEGEYEKALEAYEELAKEEPLDFRPYLCQSFIYSSLLKRESEAEKNYEKYRRLAPEGHQHARYFDDDMMAMVLYAYKIELERENSDKNYA